MNATPHMISKMIAGVVPVGVDAGLAEQRNGNVSMRSAGEPTIKRLQDSGETWAAWVRRKMLAT
jgi:hypothetical protein